MNMVSAPEICKSFGSRTSVHHCYRDVTMSRCSDIGESTRSSRFIRSSRVRVGGFQGHSGYTFAGWGGYCLLCRFVRLSLFSRSLKHVTCSPDAYPIFSMATAVQSIRAVGLCLGFLSHRLHVAENSDRKRHGRRSSTAL